MSRQPPLGICGGTFDPIHYGHLRPLSELMAALELAELRYIPAGTPPHRPPPVASAEHRLAMTRLAVAGLPGVSVDDREVRRAGPSYTVLTLESLRTEIPQRPIWLILGLDAFLGLSSWHRWQALFDLAHVVVMSRPGWQAGELPAWARPHQIKALADLRERPGGGLVFQALRPHSISSTEIRARLARGESVQGLLPEAVIDYIYSKHIYGR